MGDQVAYVIYFMHANSNLIILLNNPSKKTANHKFHLKENVLEGVIVAQIYLSNDYYLPFLLYWLVVSLSIGILDRFELLNCKKPYT